ncbi:MAG: helix-turn-helix transcriptional regulator [Mucilaginibacter sp.]|uniref:LexA family transcriptional regulator n=1 Tax=Mucilaginibacter sp. TaxID=1882438 RepID=UPI0032648942
MIDYQGERFKLYLEKRGISANRAAKALDVTRQTVYQYFRSKNLSRDTVASILSVFNVSEEEIWVTSPNPRLEASPTRLYANPLDHEDKTEKIITLPDGTMAMRVPIVPARAYAGYMRGFADPEYYDDLEDILIGVDKEPNGTYIGFEVVGDSMICLDTVELAEESIFPGRIAVGRDLDRDSWKTKLHVHNYKNWIFVHKTEGILIKQIAAHDVAEGIVTIHSLNPNYPDEQLKLEDMQQIFSVIQIVQRTRPKMK